MKFGSTALANCKFGSTQIQKIMQGGNTIWQNWKSWTKTIQNPASFAASGFTTSQYATFTNDGSYKVMKVTATAHVYCHGNISDDSAAATVAATIEVSNNNSTWTQVAASNTVSADKTLGATKSISVSYSWTGDGCPYKYIRVYSKGTSFKRYVVGKFTGYQKG